MARAERIAELLAADEVLEERPAPTAAAARAGESSSSDVSFALRARRGRRCDDVSLRIEPGERVALDRARRAPASRRSAR